MKHIQIKSVRTDKILFEGQFHSFRRCIEQAIQDGIRLDCANLKNKNLSNAMLDDAHLEHADFSDANLTGTNLSEAKLGSASFQGADLYNTCFAASDLRACRFENASFGATDITGCDISHAAFSTLSCFSLDFVQARAMEGCTFTNPDGVVARMSQPPVVIKGVSCNIIVFMDQAIKIGHDLLDYPAGIAFFEEEAGVIEDDYFLRCNKKTVIPAKAGIHRTKPREQKASF